MTNSPTRLVIVGPQGVGKATQAAQLALDRTVRINSAAYRSAVALGGPR
jgi:adenylate kinase family enzyme